MEASYEFMPLPKVQDVAGKVLLGLFSEACDTREISEPAIHPVLAQAIEALRHGNFALARELRHELNGHVDSLPDTATETALAYVDVSIAIAEGDTASAEQTLRDMFQHSVDSEPGCNLALLLCWHGRYGEARDVLQQLEAASPVALQSPLFKIINLWVAHHTTSHNTSSPRKALDDLTGMLAQSSDSPALMWHILSAACLDIGLIDASIEYAEKADHKDSKVLEYRIQHATALLHRFPATPPDYQKRKPFPVRDREPAMARVLLENVLAEIDAHQNGRFVATVYHLLGIAFYCVAVATREPRNRLKLFSQSGEAFSTAQRMSGPNSHQLTGYAGQAYLRAREFSRACDILESIPPGERNKSCETAFIVALAMDNHVDDAVHEVKLALERGQLSAEAIANVAKLVLQCGLPDDAKRLLRLAISGLERSSWIVHFLLGRAHIDLGEFEDAEHELWRAIALNSTEPRLYSAHILAFDQYIARQAWDLLAEVRQRAKGIRADTGFLSQFEQRVQHEVETYHEHVKRLNASPVLGSTIIAKSFEPIRRSVDELRRVVMSLSKLLQDDEMRDAEAFLATVRVLLGAVKIGGFDSAETPTLTPSAIEGEPWVEFQRTLAQDSSWSKAGLRLDDSGADILAHIVDRSQYPVVPHWLHLAARQVDIEARGKKLRAYSSTLGVERKPYQEAVVRRAKVRNYGRIILADEVGLGKTIEACLIFSEYRERGLVESCLILVPSRELGQQWERELKEKFQVGQEDETELGRYRAPGWSGFSSHSVCILTYQAATAHAQEVIERKWDMVICDEAHHLTNRGSERFKLLKALRNKVPYLLLLTATPIQRRVDDLFSLARLIRPSMFPTLEEFRARYCDPRNPRRIRHAGDLVRRMSEIMVRNRAGAVSSEVLLGRRRFKDLSVSLDKDEREFYEGVEALVFKAYKTRQSGKPPLAYY
jgi:tetratricopeptide (TPR) repeat protein